VQASLQSSATPCARHETTLSGWGKYPELPTELVTPLQAAGIQHCLAAHSRVVARGAGRAYGDAAVGADCTVSLRCLNRMRGFDPETRQLMVEAGVTIAEILSTFAPRGLFLKVVPGTKFVTVGGAIAADVHGKNHHRDGGFGAIVTSFRLAVAGGDILTCSLTEHSELFFATVGGMGLTGVIVEATIELFAIETAWLRQETRVAPDLDAAFSGLEDSASSTYSVAWIDCLARGPALGRSLIFRAEHATLRDKDTLGPERESFAPARPSRLSVPGVLPVNLLNRGAVRVFNELYFRRGATGAHAPQLVHWDPYFFPLDAVANWNRFYGPRGFVQHQCVIPMDNSRRVIADILDRVSRRGDASFLAVLKQLGCGSGLMSFPLRGYTLTMDFPVTDSLLAFLDELDDIVVSAGGRLYLAKDARQSRATFEAGYPALGWFKDMRAQSGASPRFASHLSARLGI